MTSVRNDYDCALLRLLMLTLQGVHVTLTVRLGDYIQKLDSFFLQFSLVCLPHGVQYCNTLRCHPTACDAIHLRCYDAVRLSVCHTDGEFVTQTDNTARPLESSITETHEENSRFLTNISPIPKP